MPSTRARPRRLPASRNVSIPFDGHRWSLRARLASVNFRHSVRRIVDSNGGIRTEGIASGESRCPLFFSEAEPLSRVNMSRTRIMSPERVRQTLRRLAYELIEHNRGADSLELFGIRQSGVPLAHTVADEINAVEGTAIEAYDLDVTPFRDDQPDLKPPPPPHDVDVTDRDVILVDDVVFTGRTARAALDAVLQYGRPHSIQLVVLVDRGHREYPIQPDCTGRRLQTKHQERVIVETGEEFAVYVED